jgi:uncharacterized protein
MNTQPAPIFLRATWTDLVMMNYEVAPAILRNRVPAGTELDLWNGRCLVSLVGFRFLDTRVLGVRVPFHADFDEINLRFYVTRDTNDERRRGAVFVKEIVPRRAIVWTANLLYNESYVAHATSHTGTRTDAGRTLTYRWRAKRRWWHMSATVSGEPAIPADDTEATFITEHYWGYSAQRDGATLEYQVAHPRWSVSCASDTELCCDVSALYGPEFVPHLAGAPSSCFVATGSPVLVRRGVRV